MLLERKLLLQEQSKFVDQVWATAGIYDVYLPQGIFFIQFRAGGGGGGYGSGNHSSAQGGGGGPGAPGTPSGSPGSPGQGGDGWGQDMPNYTRTPVTLNDAWGNPITEGWGMGGTVNGGRGGDGWVRITKVG